MNAAACLGLEVLTFPSVLHLLGYGPKNKVENWELALEEVHPFGMALVTAVRPCRVAHLIAA